MKILNVSNHKLTQEQIQMIQDYFDSEDSVEIVELPDNIREQFKNLPPDIKTRKDIAMKIIKYIEKSDIDVVHVDGEAHFTFILVNYIFDYWADRRIFKFYSKRESVEQTLPDRSVIKRHIFKPVTIIEYWRIINGSQDRPVNLFNKRRNYDHWN